MQNTTNVTDEPFDPTPLEPTSGPLDLGVEELDDIIAPSDVDIAQYFAGTMGGILIGGIGVGGAAAFAFFLT